MKFSFLLPLRETFFAVGFPVQVTTNDPRVLEAASHSFASLHLRFEAPPVRVHLAVDSVSGEPPGRATYRGRGHLLSIVCDDSNFAVCDMADRFAFGWISGRAAANRDWLRHAILEALVYSVLVQRDLTAVHAACVSRNGRGLLLCAPAGTGKTTLAYACAKAGWTYLADDAVYVLRDGAGGVILGKPQSIRFEAAAADLFPELRGLAVTMDPNGNPRIEFQTGASPEITTAEQCQLARVVFLQRSREAVARLSPMDREQAVERMLADIPSYDEPVRQAHRRSIEQLLKAKPVMLHYREYPDALPLLNSLAG